MNTMTALHLSHSHQIMSATSVSSMKHPQSAMKHPQSEFRRCHVRAAKGFGAPLKPNSKKSVKQANQQLLDKVVKEAKTSGSKPPPNWSPARPVDAKEAARGRVEFVQVKDWGSGRPEDVGKLQLADAQASTTSKQTTASHPPQQAPPGLQRPQSLFAHLATSTQSPMVTKRMKKLPEIPPYERWQFSLKRYRQYLLDMLAVHSALEQVTREVAHVAGEGSPSDSLSGVLQPLGPSLPINRAAYLRADLQAINAAMERDEASLPAADSSGTASSTSTVNARASTSQPPSTQDGSSSDTVSSHGTSSSRASSSECASDSSAQPGTTNRQQEVLDAALGRASPSAAAYAQYLQQLSRSWQSAESTEEQVQVVGRLLAHSFVVHTSFAALATRLGAAAAEKLNLFSIGAVAAYQEYPQGVKDPVDEVKGAVDRVEAGVKERGVLQGVCDWSVHEMPRALEDCSLLIMAVAVE